MNFIKRLNAAQGPALFFLGQAGFLIKTKAGRRIAIDPYFSDFVENGTPDMGQAYKRMTPPPCEDYELGPDALVISHEHGDHFDPDSAPVFMQNPAARAYANAPSAEGLIKLGVEPERVTTLRKNEPLDICGARVTPVDCDHGSLAPEALGFLIEIAGKTIYYAGDTALTPDRLRVPLAARPDVAILPINGMYGNLDGVAAAKYAGMLRCKICIPCHFWLFPQHHGDPQTFLDALPQYAPGCEPHLMCLGEKMRLE